MPSASVGKPFIRVCERFFCRDEILSRLCRFLLHFRFTARR